jgi:predicted alpha/beta-fold hydrolase
VPITTFKHLENDPHISLLVTKHGGHNGFIENYAFEDFSIKLAIEEFGA